jgi:hypothetical protein
MQVAGPRVTVKMLLSFHTVQVHLSICSGKCEIVYVSMFKVIFDRYGAKVYVKNLQKPTSSLSGKNTRNVVIEIFKSLQSPYF